MVHEHPTPTFSVKYSTFEDFKLMWSNSPFYTKMLDTELKDIYWHLYTEYMVSHFKYWEPSQIDLQIACSIQDYYPVLKKKLELNKRAMEFTESELEEGMTIVSSSMSNPDIDVPTPLSKDLPYTAEKSLSQRKRDKISQLTAQYGLLQDTLWDEFVSKFKKHFIVLLVGTSTLLTSDSEAWNE